MSSCCAPELTADATETTRREKQETAQWLRLGFSALMASQAMILSQAMNLASPGGFNRWLLHGILIVSTLAVILLVSPPLLRESWAALRRRRVVMEQLFLLGIFGAFFASLLSTLRQYGSVYYEVVAILLTIYTWGKLLGQQRRDHTLRAASLLAEQHATCRRRTPSGTWEKIPTRHVQPHDLILVQTADRVAVDGRVQEGTAYVQETALTGEPFPVVKRPGDRILAGSQVLDAHLVIHATQAGDDRQLDHLLRSVRQAQSALSPLQREADRIVAWFLPAVAGLALATLIFWTWRVDWATGLFNGLAVLLVACPCAMGLATPIAWWGALGALAKRGIRTKSSEFIERLAGVNEVIFDKTGTLSEDGLSLVDFVTIDSSPRPGLRNQVARAQQNSLHPVARAFQRPDFFTSESVTVLQTKNLPAIGLHATLQKAGGTVTQLEIGNAALLLSGDSLCAQKLRTQCHAQTRPVHEIWIRENGQLVGLALLQETLRDSVAPAFAQLRRMGIEPIVLTGDRSAGTLGNAARRIETALTATAKAERIRALQQRGRRVLFIGDGVNDAPALAQADASLALAHGAPLANETAQAHLHELNLQTVPEILSLARQTVRGIRQNLLFAACYNGLGILAAASGWLHPIVAALLMLAASFSVTWRALRFSHRVQTDSDFAPPAPARSWRELLRHGLRRSTSLDHGLYALAFFALSVLLAGLSRASGPLAPGLLVTGALAGAAVVFLGPRLRHSPGWQMTIAMLSAGNVGMVLGWWADNHFGSMLAVSTCAMCAAHGAGSLSPHLFWNWMNAGMVVLSFPAMMAPQNSPYFPGNASGRRWAHALWMSAGMTLGMAAAMPLMNVLPDVSPLGRFFAGFGLMNIGMMLGMWMCCGIWRASFHLWMRRQTAPARSTWFTPPETGATR